MKSGMKSLPAVFTAGAVAVLAAAGAASAYVDTTYKYSTPKTGYLVLPAAAFMPPNNTASWSNDGLHLQSSNGCFVGPINLPQGSKITTVAYWYRRASTSDLTVELTRWKLSDESPAQLISDAPDDDTGTRKARAVTVSNPLLQTVDNRLYQYILTVCLRDAVDKFHSARITYTYANAGD